VWWNYQGSFLSDIGKGIEADYGLFCRMLFLENVYTTVSHLRNSRGADIHNLSISERKIIAELIRQGLYA